MGKITIRRIFFWSAGFITISAILLVSFILVNAIRSVPDYKELREIQHQQASVILTSDGQQIGSFYTQNRTNVDLKDISPDFIDALISIEDIRFHQHGGMDYRALMRVVVRSILLRQNAGGGSTLTQQLVKNLYPRTGNGHIGLASDKLKEILTALRLEKLYTKDEILELYLNTVSFGENTFGIETASNRFFNKPSLELEPQEAAVLAGVLRAPGFYNPKRYPGRAEQRRNLVIRQMEKYGKISSQEADTLISKPLELDYNRLTTHEGPAPHFREHLRVELQKILDEQPAVDGNYYNLYTDGLIIRTTIDSNVQKAAEDALKRSVKALQENLDTTYTERIVHDNHRLILRAWRSSSHFQKLVESGMSEEEIEQVFNEPKPMNLFTWNGEVEQVLSPHDSIKHYMHYVHAGMFAMSPNSGRVKAWVGGINHEYFQFDHVKSRRQSGSAFKPIVYAAALEAGKSPCDYQRNLLNRYQAYEDWTPRNVREEYGGYLSLQAALSGSVNTIAVDVLMETGIDRVRSKAADMGIRSYIPAEPSIALGTAEMSLFELTQSYAAFASGGYSVIPFYVDAIYSPDGRLLYKFDNPNDHFRERVISGETAAVMVEMLSKTVDEGTASSLRSGFGLPYAIAGKTGTTQNYTDGWFIGMTPDLVFGTWTGAWNPAIRFPESMGYASQTALPIAGHFLTNLSQNEENSHLADYFHDHQISHTFDTSCPDYRDDSLIDRFRDFVTGRNSDDPRVVNTEEENRSFRDRIRSFFSRD